MADKIELRALKKGEFFKRSIKGAPSKTVYVKGSYDKSSKRFDCSKFEDVNAFIQLKPSSLIFSDFTF